MRSSVGRSPDRWRRASSADAPQPSSSLHAGASRNGAEESQQSNEWFGANTSKAIEKRRRQADAIDRRHELGVCDPPERRGREHVAPPSAPTLHSAAVDADDLCEPLHPGVGHAVPQDCDQHDDRRNIDAAAEEAQRRRRLPRPAAVNGTAEAEALIVLGAQPTGPAARLARVSRRMQPAAAQRAALGLAGVGKIAIDGEQQIVESGIGRSNSADCGGVAVRSSPELEMKPSALIIENATQPYQSRRATPAVFGSVALITEIATGSPTTSVVNTSDAAVQASFSR